MSRGISSCNIIKYICGLRLPTRHYQLCFELFRTRRLFEITEDSHKYTRDESLGEDIHGRGAYAAFCAGNTRQSARSQCEGVGNRRQGRDPVFYLNDVKGEPPRLESGRVAALSIHQPLSISIVSLFIPSPPALRTRPSCAATFTLSLSLYRMVRAERNASNSRTRTSRSLCEYYSALHSRFFCRVMLYRDAPLFKGENVDTVLFLRWLFST